MTGKSQGQDSNYVRRLPLAFLVGILGGTMGSAFCAGYFCRRWLLHEPLGHSCSKEDGFFPGSTSPPFHDVSDGIHSTNSTPFHSGQFHPEMVVHADSLSALLSDGVGDVAAVLDSSARGETDDDDDDDDELDKQHAKYNRHLLVDVENVDGQFLNSKPRLAKAILDLANQVDLSVLSYHCYSLVPSGITCLGLSMGSHLSFRTWPDAGVLSLDIFISAQKPLRLLLDSVKETFGVPVEEDVRMRWSFKNRGFPFDAENSNPEEVWMEHFMLGRMSFEMKEQLVSAETNFQTVEIYKVIDPSTRSRSSYQTSLDTPDSYEGQHAELFQPDRVVYLDEVMQSRLRGDAAYHEALVHPGMFTHPNPKRVAIIGGGEGATLREVLKHSSVEYVAMIEIDEEMVSVSAKYLPEWSDCSHIAGSRESCYDDPRAETFFEDAIAWFINRYLKVDHVKKEDEFDVVIMDALDPHSAVGFSDVLYNNSDFAQAISNSLGESGVFLAQIGEDFGVDDPPTELSLEKIHEAVFMQHLQHQGFQAIKDYSEAHGGFGGVWRFLVALKDETNQEWYRNAAEVDLAIQRRSMPSSVSGKGLFRFFDGATMMSYQYPHRFSEEIYCRSNPHDGLCLKYQAPVGGVGVEIAEIEVDSRVEWNFRRGLNRNGQAASESWIDVLPSSLELMKKMSQLDQRARKWNMFNNGTKTDLYLLPKAAAFVNYGEFNRTESLQGEKTVYPHIYCPLRDRHLHSALVLN